MPSEYRQRIIDFLSGVVYGVDGSIKRIGENVILCSPRIRLPLYQLLERHIPTIVVISYSELITDIKVEAIDSIGESYATE